MSKEDEQALRTLWSILTDPDPKRAKILMQDKYSERMRRELLIGTRQSLHELAQADRRFQKFMRRAMS
jgi:hypothetical protein